MRKTIPTHDIAFNELTAQLTKHVFQRREITMDVSNHDRRHTK
jgi:hypothetical protein